MRGKKIKNEFGDVWIGVLRYASGAANEVRLDTESGVLQR